MNLRLLLCGLLLSCTHASQPVSASVKIERIFQNIYAPHTDKNSVVAGSCEPSFPLCLEVDGQFIPLPRNGVSLGTVQEPGTAIVVGRRPGSVSRIRLFVMIVPMDAPFEGVFEFRRELYCPEGHCVIRGI